ncbi:hypothetical protein M2322_002691 [Rhodoblastus acidophilus]|uniref:phage nozzle protein n=1 Tax=Rhodoblastus acidophilus TaxID=1074 RepID=UPI002225ACCE|nr:hypothetical protein [Rhodoblastus acidophilus]MCW2317137.1 hypothetical protein [Rhodoblastus acidophilus]
MVAKGFQSRPIPSIIQGVSQQVAQQRRDSQCEAQFDCVNSPRLGVVARPGADILSYRNGVQRPGAFTYELRRGLSEHYLMVLYNGTLEVYDLSTGSPCAVSDNTGGDGYLASTPGVLDSDNFRVQTVGDYTFIVNRSRTPSYTGERSPSRPPEALVFFKEGNYLQTYTLSVTCGGATYTYTYTTPDNSISTNGSYIYTNQLAATFYRAMTGSVSPSNVPGDPGGSGSSAQSSGSFGGNTYVTTGVKSSLATSGGFLTDHGFQVAINGNLLYICRPNDSTPFTVTATDGSGSSAINVIQGTTQAFSDLPLGGFTGFVVNITGTSSGAGNSSNGYWVTYNGNSWVECPAPGVLTTLDPTTMPHTIFCSAVNTFAIQKPSWMDRICGDAVNTAIDPYFVGRKIQNISFYQARLVFITEGYVDFSKSNQEFTFFPDTVQSVLSNGPISETLAASDTTSLLRAAVCIDESLVLWAQLAQFRINSGVQPLAPETIQTPQSTAYEFNEHANFVKMGTSVFFSYEASDWATVLNLQYAQGRAQSDTDVTAHVQAYIPKGVRGLSLSQTLNMMFVRTDGLPNCLYLYNYLNEGQSVVQSAWNTWRLPAGSVLWHGIYLQTLYILHQRADGLMLLQVPLNLNAKDAGAVDYLTRLDLRISEANVTSAVYNQAANTTTISWVHQVAPSEQPSIAVVARITGKHVRGRKATVSATTATSVTVNGDWSGQPLYVGLGIVSQRQESQFSLRTATGVIPCESLKVRNFIVNCDTSGYTRIDIVQGSGGMTKRSEFFPVPVGQAIPALGAPPTLGTGELKIACDTEANELTVTLTNDTHLPSRWTSTEWQFVAVERPTPMLTPYGGPVQ